MSLHQKIFFKKICILSSQTRFLSLGLLKNRLSTVKVRKNGVLTPDYEANWKIIGNYWDEELHNLVKELANEGIIEVNKYKPVRMEDIQSFIKTY